MSVLLDEKLNLSHQAGKLLVEDVTFIKQRNDVVITCLSDGYFMLDERSKMEKQLLDMFSVNKVFLKLKYSINNRFLTNYGQLIFNDLMRLVQEKSPKLKHWATFIKIECNKGILFLTTNNQFAKKFLIENKIDRQMIDYTKDLLGNTIQIQVSDSKLSVLTSTETYMQQKQKESIEILSEVISAKTISEPKANKQTTTSRKSVTVKAADTIYGRDFKVTDVSSIADITEDIGMTVFKGRIFQTEKKEIQDGKKVIFSMFATDYTNSIPLKVIASAADATALSEEIKNNNWYYFRGALYFDTYQRENVFRINAIKKASVVEKNDNEAEKRIELHLHTKMSAMDAVSSVEDLVGRAGKWGHEAIAITDHGNIQSFPTAHFAGKKNGVKIIYGLESYLINDCITIAKGANSDQTTDTFVAFDIETTGLKKQTDKIISIGAVKFVGGEATEKFYELVNPLEHISDRITELTGITNENVESAEEIDTILPRFLEFCGAFPVVAHNSNFDDAFISREAERLELEWDNVVIDTLLLAQHALPDQKTHKLNVLCDKLGIILENHHNAYDDALAAGLLFIELLKKINIKAKESFTPETLNFAFNSNKPLNEYSYYHAVILVKNYTGLRNLYELVSESHMEYFFKRPRILKSRLNKMRDGLIIGSACEAGELYKALVKGTSYGEVLSIANFYDYLEIQPTDNNMYMVRNGTLKNRNHIQKLNKRIVSLGKKLGKPVVATGDVHFLDPEDEAYRRVLMGAQGFKDADEQAPLYYRTTGEMLEEFNYLDEQTARDVVIHAPQKINAMIETIQPVPDGLFPPEIEGADDDVRHMSMDTARSMYGDDLPEIVIKRLEKELNSIITHGYAVLYLIAHKLVKKSNDDGYLVGSRGSVGSSFVATMCGITEVNPLKPHYLCPACKHSDFEVDDEKYGCGADMPDAICPKCGETYSKLGFNIPFEVFLGFKGDKVPDIDLNFSGDYQPQAHKYTEVLLGEGNVFRAGTISTIASKTAYGFAKKYYDQKEERASNAEITRVLNGFTGVKRSTGQHPGGLMVVPKSKTIYDFTPIQYPANAKDSGVVTTHFEYTYIHDNLVKLDILGHDDPTVIRMLEDLTGINAKEIPLDEQKTMSLFTATDALGVTPEDINSKVGTMGLPEFGTAFVRQMLVDTQPTTFNELIRISGLSHGTDVWLNNAKDLVQDGTATLSQVICTRDDIMIYLMHRQMEPAISFKIMESVRKGRGLTEEFETTMKECNVPDWYIDSCKKIKYMFPRAHAAAYVIMAFRIAYFKVYYPKAFYATYFTVRADEFDYELMTQSKEALLEEINKLNESGNKLTAREKNLQTIIEMVIEMFARNIEFVSIDLYKADAEKFIIVEQGIMPPLSSIQGVGINAAKNIVNAREEKRFISLEDLRTRGKVSKTTIEVFKEQKIVEGLQDSNQVSFF